MKKNIFSSANTLKPLKNTKKGYEVFGFAPYWTLNSLQNVDFNVLTTCAYFDIGLQSDGSLDKDGNGYRTFTSQAATDLFTKAHASGTRVVATITQMDNETIRNFVDNPGAQQYAISQIVDMVDQRGIDGVNIDFEYTGDPGQGYRDEFSQFIANLTTAMHQRIPSSQVTLSVSASAVKDPKIYDIQNLGQHADGIFMMAYDFATTSAQTVMPTAPLYGYKEGKYWYDVSTAVDDFLSYMPANKLILGLPWYGYDYPVYSPQQDAQTISWGEANTETYSVAEDQVTPAVVGSDNFRTGWDSSGQVGWKAYYSPQSGTWRMMFLDDARSLGIKYDFAKEKNLEGVGMWALGFDDGKKDLWNVLEEKFGVKFADTTVIQRKISPSQ